MFNLLANNIMQVNRGDSFTVPLFININNDMNPIQYKLQDGAEIYFGVMEPNQFFEDAIIRKKYTSDNLNVDGNIDIIFNSDDTAYLLPGLYYYQIKAKLPLEDGSFVVNTIVPKTQFYILE